GWDDRHLHPLAAEPVLRLADDLLDAVVHPLAEREERVDPRPERADVARSQEKAVGGHLDVGGIVAERGEEELGKTHRRRIAGSVLGARAAGTRAIGGFTVAPWEWSETQRSGSSPLFRGRSDEIGVRKRTRRPETGVD